MMDKSWVQNYTGLEYENQGRSLTGVDCWGLAILIYRDVFGIELPAYGDISAENLIQIYRTMNVDKDCELWEPIPIGEQKMFDICVMRGEGVRHVCHVGIVVDSKTILHVEKGINSVIVPVKDASIRERIVCYRRHREVKF